MVQKTKSKNIVGVLVSMTYGEKMKPRQGDHLGTGLVKLGDRISAQIPVTGTGSSS
jgi:hypothetical protein